MKRFLSLFALMVAPALAWSADTGAVNKVKDVCSMGPTSPTDETWADRTDLSATFYGSSARAFYGLNTIQPLYRSEGMNHTVYAQAGLGMKKLHENGRIGLGLGYRYMTACGGHMFGAGIFYYDKQPSHNHHSKDGVGVNLEWLTRYTTLQLGRYEREHREWRKNNVWRMFDLNKARTTLDLEFQLPYLPWTMLNLGYTWHHRHGGDLKQLEYRLDFNLVGPLVFQIGHRRDFVKSGYARFVVNFGRPAVREYTLADGFLGDTCFTARDLRDYTLMPVQRARVN